MLIFMGTVADMSEAHLRAVHTACRVLSVPVARMNLGHNVAEFASKILDVVHGHHIHGKLLPAVRRKAAMLPSNFKAANLIGFAKDDPQRKKTRENFIPGGRLHFFVPHHGRASQIVPDARRRELMYDVPRCCIAALWRSRGEYTGRAVSFVFTEDGAGEVYTVNASLVTCLKLQHRAAPTERNVMIALRQAQGDEVIEPGLVIDEGCCDLAKPEAAMNRLRERHAEMTGKASRGSAGSLMVLELRVGAEEEAEEAEGWPRLDLHSPHLIFDQPMSGCTLIVILAPTKSGAPSYPRGFVSNFLVESGRRFKVIHRKASIPRVSMHVAITMLSHRFTVHGGSI